MVNKFVEVYRTASLFKPLIVLYRAYKEGCICLKYGDEERYFLSFADAVCYARERGWISENDTLAKAKEGIRYLDRQEDRRMDELHEASMLSKAINAIVHGRDPSDDIGESFDRLKLPRFFR